MAEPFALPQWSALAGADDASLRLLDTALLIAHDEYPRLDATYYAGIVERHAAHLRDAIAGLDHFALKMQAINHYLFSELGYAGDHDAYYDPRNSYLNQVFERRLGNPISLALVQIEVSRRLGIPLDGVSFPGHFLVRLPVEDGVLVMDPFNRGRPLGVDELRERAQPHMDGRTPDDETLSRILHPASHRAILIRVLRNLQGVYQDAGDWERTARCADRILKLAPDDGDALRDRGLGYLYMGHLAGAREDLSRYLLRHPGAADATRIREQLIETGRASALRH